MFRTAWWVMVASALLAACDKTPAPPSVPPGDATITGNERLGWDQHASDAVELATFRYAIFVDGTRSELSAVACDSLQSTGGFACSAPLPRMPAGAHTLELATFLVDGTTLLESDRTPALRVVVANALTVVSPAPRPGAAHQITTSDGVVVRVEIVRTDLAEPADVAFAPDRRLFVAESAGAVRIAASAADAGIASAVPGRPLALTLDPAFTDTHLVFVLYVGRDGEGRSLFTIARFREVDGRLADRVILSDSTLASADARGTLRFGPDGKLYAAFDDGGAPGQADDLASANGKILRLEKDGTTPADQDGMTPMFAHGLHAPRAIAWSPATRDLWAADEPGPADPMLLVARAASPRVRGLIRAAYRLPPPTAPAAMTFYASAAIPQFDGNLFVASDAGEDLFRIRFDPADANRVLSTERLLRNQIGPMRAIVQSPDGALYIATDTTLWRLSR